MIKKEYLTVTEISKLNNTGTRNIRKIITQIQPTTSKELLFKDSNNCWQVHHILTSKFAPKNMKRNIFYALTVDFGRVISEIEIHEIMNWIASQMVNNNIEINYVIENKKANNNSHIHCYLNCKERKKLIKNLQLGFSQVSYRENEIFDLVGWKNYMEKDGKKITTIKK